MGILVRKWIAKGKEPVPAVSLAFFRIVFGALMLVSIVRFIGRGWIYDFYIKPQFFFSFYGFGWLRPLSDPFIYWLFYGMAVLALLVMLGLFYRFAIIAFFLSFTYVELLDKSVYLNHYYQVSLLALLMCILPMNRVYALDHFVFKRPVIQAVPRWMLGVLQMQVGIVYFFGGLAKLRYDWLFEAQPLRIWLSANGHLPLIGPLLGQVWVAFVISWLAMAFDLSAPFLLSFKKTRTFIYIVIVLFHLLTHILFNIGMFPWMMIFTALIFFPAGFHQKILGSLLGKPVGYPMDEVHLKHLKYAFPFLVAFFAFQFAMPFRGYLYPGNVLWHEQGFRFSWNIMLMEKNASLEYEVKVLENGNTFTVRPEKFLTQIQARQCSFQPDMILQFAHFLHTYYLDSGLGPTEIRAICYASVNGHESKLLIDPETNLVEQQDGFIDKKWITR